MNRKMRRPWEEVERFLAVIRVRFPTATPLTLETHAAAIALARDHSLAFYDASPLRSKLGAKRFTAKIFNTAGASATVRSSTRFSSAMVHEILIVGREEDTPIARNPRDIAGESSEITPCSEVVTRVTTAQFEKRAEIAPL
jgi:hypothetical protein